MGDQAVQIRVAILEDHRSIIDGYLYRLSQTPGIVVVGTACFDSELETLLASQPVDVVFLDIHVKTAPNNPTPYPIFHVIATLNDRYPELSVLVISMVEERALIQQLMKAGARGYIIKDETDVIEQLGTVVKTIAAGGNYMSERVYALLNQPSHDEAQSALTLRQLEALSLCAANPNWSRDELAAAMHITSSSARNLLSGAYFRLQVNTLPAAIEKARALNLITPASAKPPDLTTT